MAAIWLRTNIVPPDCEDARTLALVRQSIGDRFGNQPHMTFGNIRTHAGGYLAFRFACEADIEGIDRDALPEGPVPGTVHYISRLTPDHERHVVSVRIQPAYKWEPVQ